MIAIDEEHKSASVQRKKVLNSHWFSFFCWMQCGLQRIAAPLKAVPLQSHSRSAPLPLQLLTPLRPEASLPAPLQLGVHGDHQILDPARFRRSAQLPVSQAGEDDSIDVTALTLDLLLVALDNSFGYRDLADFQTAVQSLFSLSQAGAAEQAEQPEGEGRGV